MGEPKAQCIYCNKKLCAKGSSGTKHLHCHLDICTMRKIKLGGMKMKKTLAQSSLRLNSSEGRKVSVEHYTFDQDVARKALAAMIILHEYPLCMVDHIGFRRFVSALQPLFKIVTRNTIRKDIMDAYKEENKRALQYMGQTKSRVAITIDMWTSDNQRRGYMAITAHFIDDSWTLRKIIMRFIYVPTPHTAEVICEQLYEALVEWNVDEKISTVTLDNCSTNDVILDWWKVAGTRYPTLRKIACDIFAIPVSTVASESAFSTSGRVLSEHRSQLTPEILEALMCSQDWLQNKYKDVENGDRLETFWSCLQKIQEGVEGVALC